MLIRESGVSRLAAENCIGSDARRARLAAAAGGQVAGPDLVHGRLPVRADRGLGLGGIAVLFPPRPAGGLPDRGRLDAKRYACTTSLVFLSCHVIVLNISDPVNSMKLIGVWFE